MIKTIYRELGFAPLRAPIYSKAVIEGAKKLFNAFPLKNTILRPCVIEQTIREETFAISTAEGEALTREEADKIVITPEFQARLEKYRNDVTLTAREKYERLENENIRDIENNMSGIAFGELSVDFLCELHRCLTIGLDEYAHDLGIARYHPFDLRKSNATKVGKMRQYTPPDHKTVSVLLKSLFKSFAGRKTIYLTDILEFHILLYAVHPFSNGNKRVCRLLESLLLNHYGYSADKVISLSVYYGEKKESYNFFFIESLRNSDVGPFVNFGIRGYFYAGIKIFSQNLENFVAREYAPSYGRKVLNFFNQDKTKSKKTLKHYQRAAKVIMELNGVFTHKQFTDQMKRHGCALGVSQEILKFLKKEKLLLHKDRLYFIESAPEVNQFNKELTRFLLKNNIQTEE
ncbi:Fic family protein [Candidatus Peregrinibacteria bacterium]|nr:Fic family protein [Candidatus Peregrinibacteria bacterium]